MNSSQQIKWGALMSYFSLGINILTGLIFTPWMISSIGKADYGLYTLAMSVISLFVFDFGLSSAVVRFLSKYLAEGRQDKANSFAGLVYKLYIYIDLVLLVVLTVLYFFIPSIYRELTPAEIDKFKIVFAISAVFTVLSFPFIPANGILTSYEKFVQLRLCDVLHKILIVGAMTICLLLDYGLYALVIVNAVSGLIMIVFKIWFIKRDTNLTVSFDKQSPQDYREVLGFSVWTTIIAVCQRMIFSIAPTILGIFSGSTVIAVFGIANVIEGYIYSFSNALSGMFLPKVSRILSKDNGDIMPLMIRVGRLQLFVVSAVVMGFVCVGREFICLWVGNDFSESYICTVLLIIPSLYHLPQEIGMQAIVATNRVKLQAYIWILMAVLNLLLSFLLTWKFGVIGLCTSICISFLIRTVGIDIIFSRNMGLEMMRFFRNTYFKILFMITAVTSLSFIVFAFIPGDGVVVFIIKCLVYMVLFCTGAYVVSNEDEKTLILSPLKSMFSKMKRQ